MEIPRILVIHGPNLHLLGKVASQTTKSRLTLSKIDRILKKRASELGCELKIYHLFGEEKILKTISYLRNRVAGILIAPGSLSKSAYTLLEILKIIKIPFVEVHLAEMPDSESSFEQSLFRESAYRRFYDFGEKGYLLALDSLAKVIFKNEE